MESIITMIAACFMGYLSGEVAVAYFNYRLKSLTEEYRRRCEEEGIDPDDFDIE